MATSRFNLITTPNSYLFVKENADCYSPQQLNEHFKWVIDILKKKTPMFSKLHGNDYYVFLGRDKKDTALIFGNLMLTFSASVPTVKMLREKLLHEGTSFSEEAMLSQAIENAFDSHRDTVYARISIYAYVIQRLHEVSSITDDTLHDLLDRVKDRIEAVRDLLQHAFQKGEAEIAADLLEKYKSQKWFLEKEIHRRYLRYSK